MLSRGADPLSGIRLFRGERCAQCAGTRFRGPVGLLELFEVDDRIRRMIRDRAGAASIRDAAIATGVKTMLQEGFAKMILDETTLEEVLRVTR